MFALSYKSQRNCCRAVFLLACLLPTVAVAACAVWRHLPGQVRSCERDLTARLGLPVKLDAVSHPRPGVVSYEGLELIDPETGRMLFRTRSLEVDSTGTVTLLIVSQAEVSGAHHQRLWQLLQSQFVDRRAASEVRFTAGEVTIDGQPQASTLIDVEGRIGRDDAGAEATLRFRVAGLKMGQPALLRVATTSKQGRSSTTIHLETGSASLPCSLAAVMLPDVGHLGPDAHFAGHIVAEQSAAGWNGHLVGEFRGLDLYSLVTARYPHRLNGPAQLSIGEARFHAGRLSRATGTLSAGPGVVSGSLLDSAAASLSVLRPGSAGTADQLVFYEEFVAGFAIDENGLEIQGHCGRRGSGHIMVNRSGVLLADPPRQPVPVVALVRTLVPQNAVQVPATRETEALIGWLPVPHIQRPRQPGEGETAPTGRILRSVR